MTTRPPLNAKGFSLALGEIESEDLSRHIPRPDMQSRRAKLTRVFQIGFNKCGTRSLYRFLQRSGIYSAHFNRGILAQNIKDNIEAGRKPLYHSRSRNDYVGYTDIQRVTLQGAIEAINYYKEFYAYYPNSYFILNTRDKEGWLRSRVNHGAGSYLNRYRVALGFSDTASVLSFWSDDWDRHHEEVISFFADKPGRLIVYDIKNDHPQKMVDFLAPDFLSVPEFFRHEGATETEDTDAYAKNAPVVINRRS